MSSREVSQLRTYSDGASRGNPGPAAVAAKIVNNKGVVLKKWSRFLGRRTNNEAEYEALIIALNLARDFTDGYVQCFLDSELVVKQLNSEYRVRNPRLKKFWCHVRELQQNFRSVSFNHLPRDNRNMQEVDGMANRVLDKMLK